jgi:putative FmdB family regulatory protein
MPLYEYQCDVCENRFEVIQKFSDAPIQACPNCGGAVQKLLSSPAIQFKGTGWYITDYARKGGSGSGKSESKPGAPSDSKSDAGTGDSSKTSESKPAGGGSKPE